MPTSQPTSKPTTQPTAQPSARPTSSPTLSWETQWAERLKALTSLVVPAEDEDGVENMIFSKISGGGDGAFIGTGEFVSMGSCKSWQLFSARLAKSRLNYRVLSFSIYGISSLQAPLPVRASDVGFGCVDADTADGIVDYVTGLSSAKSITCAGVQTWTAQRCVDKGYTLDIKVANRRTTYAMSPCTDCMSDSTDTDSTGLSMVVVKIQRRSIAPRIRVTSIIPTKNSVAINVELASEGSVKCAVFPQGTVPQSVDVVFVSGTLGSYGDNSSRTSIYIEGLSAYTEYRSYCVSMSHAGSYMSRFRMLATRQDFTTLCCKVFSVALTAGVVGISNDVAVSSSPLARAVKISMDSGPTTELTIFFLSTCDVNGVSEELSLFYPRSLKVSPGVVFKDYMLNFVGSPPTTCTFVFQLNGTSVHEYQINYVNGDSFSVISASTPIARPHLVSATFSENGDSVSLKFNSPTNRANMKYSFSCDTLLTFIGNQVASCFWKDDSTILIYSNVLSIGDLVVLGPNVVGAACYVGICPSNIQSTSQSQVIISAPSNVVNPVVIISTVQYLNPTSPCLIDVLSSIGNGGRPWQNITVRVFSVFTNTFSIQSFINSPSFSLFAPTAIPSNFFIAGNTYTFAVTLCNFMQACSTEQTFVTIMSTPTPTVSILGPNARSISISDTLNLQSRGFSNTGSGVIYYWEVDNVGANNKTLDSTSRDPSKFILPAFSLSISVVYKFTVHVLDVLSQDHSEAHVYVNVKPADIAIVISGGKEQSFVVGYLGIIDATKSYDGSVFDSLNNLVFDWDFIQTYPVFDHQCPISYEIFHGYVQIEPSMWLDTSTVCQVLLTVSDKTLTRVSSTTINIEFISSPVFVSITSVVPAVINSNEKFTLTGSVSMSSTTQVATWSVNDPSLDLDLASSTASTVTLSTKNAATFSVNLVLQPGTLKGMSTYIFTLSCTTSSGKSSHSSVLVTVNGSPIPGDYSILPVSGTELSTSFRFIAQNWLDDNLPMTYSFGFISPLDGNLLVVQGRSVQSFGYSMLPAGNARENFVLKAILHVFDAFEANATDNCFVTVNNTLESTTSIMKSLLNRATSAIGDLDTMRQVASISLSALNSLTQNVSESSHISQTVRQDLLVLLNNITKIDEPTKSSVESWMTSIQSATSVPFDLNSDASQTVLDTLDTIIEYSPSVGLSSGMTTSILYSVDSVISWSIYAHGSGNRRLDNYRQYYHARSFNAVFGNIRAVLAKYGQFVLNDTILGEYGTEYTTSNFRSFFQLLSTKNVPVGINSLYRDEQSTQLTLPFSSTGIQVGVSAFFVNQTFFNQPSILSDPVFLSLYYPPSADLKLRDVSITLPNVELFPFSNKSSFVVDRVIRTRCFQNRVESKVFLCPNDYNLTIFCNGSAGVLTTYCPVMYDIPSCGSIASGSSQFQHCRKVAENAYNTTCTCSLSPLSDGAISTNIIAYKASTYYLFNSSFYPLDRSASLNLIFSSKVSITAAALVIAGILAMLFSFDYRRPKKMTNKKVQPSLYKAPAKYYHNVVSVMRRYHQYFNVLTAPSVDQGIPRARSFGILSFMFVFGLFFQSGLFDIFRSQADQCNYFYNQKDCLAYRGALDFTKSTCAWDDPNLLCAPMTYPGGFPAIDLLYIVCITSFFAQFVNSFAEFVRIEVLGDKAGIAQGAVKPAPNDLVLSSPRPVNRAGLADKLRVADIFSIVTPKSTKVVMEFDDDLPEEAPLLTEFTSMVKYICSHRDSLESLAHDKFDHYWGFNDISYADEASLKILLSKMRENVSFWQRDIPILMHLYTLLDSTRRQLFLELDRCVGMTEFARGYRLLHAFQRAMIPACSADILDAYDLRVNFRGSTAYSRLLKFIVTSFLFIAYCAMIYFIVLFGMSNIDDIQIALLQSFVLWCIYEIFVLEVLTVYIQHIVVPSHIADDLRNSKDRIINLLANITDDEIVDSLKKDKSVPFSLSSYVSVPYRLAQYFPELKLETKLIRSNTDVTPDDINKRMADPDWTRQIFAALMRIPLFAQDYTFKVSCILSGVSKNQSYFFTLICIYSFQLSSCAICSSLLLSLAHVYLKNPIYHTLASVFIYGMWGIWGIAALYFVYRYIITKRKISPLSIEADNMKDVVDGLQKTTYQCRDYVSLENSFLLRPECSSIPSVADLAIALVPGEFDHSEIAFDFSVIPNQELEDVLRSRSNIGVFSVDDEPIEFDMSALSADEFASVLDENRNPRSRAPTSLFIDTMEDDLEDDQHHQNDYMYNVAMSLHPDEILAVLEVNDAAQQEFEQFSNMYDAYGENDDLEFLGNTEFDFDKLTKEEIEAALGVEDDTSDIRPAKETKKTKRKAAVKSSGYGFSAPRSAARSVSSAAKEKKPWKSAQPGGIKSGKRGV